jgi:membrane protein insertase Oxa1/YidC/SpoIIIJ
MVHAPKCRNSLFARNAADLLATTTPVSIWSTFVRTIQDWIAWTAGALGVSDLFAILLVTALARALLLPISYPLAAASRTWQHAFRKIRPRMKEVRKLHKDNPRKSIDEVNRLHREAGIGQVDRAGLLLALVQIPLLIAFFQAVLELRGDSSLTMGTVALAVVAGALSLWSISLDGQTHSRAFLAVAAVLPVGIVLWLGQGIGAYLVGFYGVTLVQSALLAQVADPVKSTET